MKEAEGIREKGRKESRKMRWRGGAKEDRRMERRLREEKL